MTKPLSIYFLLSILLCLCSCTQTSRTTKLVKNIDNKFKARFKIANGHLLAPYLADSLHDKNYYLAINDCSHNNQYLSNIDKISTQNINKKLESKKRRLLKILNSLNQQHHLFKETSLKKLHDSYEIFRVSNKLPIFNPLIYGQVTSHFGVRHHPVKCKKRMHNGIDIAGRKNAKIYAAAYGIVEEVKNSKTYGKYIVISHSYGFKTKYAHLSKVLVNKGDRVLAAEYIGLQGHTGLTNNKPHLHFEIIYKNKLINPWSLIKYSYQN